jgi:hypothetical protein
MKKNDQILLEKLYSNILNEEGNNKVNSVNGGNETNNLEKTIQEYMKSEKFSNVGNNIEKYIEKTMDEMLAQMVSENPELEQMDPDDVKSYMIKPLYLNIMRTSSHINNLKMFH